ncbi:MAG: hypothetical protein LBP95_11090 [Deltaproteobacteria bacterium]|jgi:hypothetical protein|nr:hypothetical protein [Deltaproteobacteria bacterium]
MVSDMSNVISSQSRTPLAAQPKTNRAAWREEMLGQLLAQMRERSPKDDQAERAPGKLGAFGKGQYVDVYV